MVLQASGGGLFFFSQFGQMSRESFWIFFNQLSHHFSLSFQPSIHTITFAVIWTFRIATLVAAALFHSPISLGRNPSIFIKRGRFSTTRLAIVSVCHENQYMIVSVKGWDRAIGEIRTPGLLITNQVLYQLSYNGSGFAT